MVTLGIQRRFEQKYIPEPNSGCWLWLGAVTTKVAYGKFLVYGKLKLAHRVSWNIYRGQIPDGYEIDHRVCRNKLCVNPDHMVPCTSAEHLSQPDSGGQINSAKTHCPHGHPYSGDNLYIPKKTRWNRRTCIACREAYQMRTQDAKKAYEARRRVEKRDILLAKNREYRRVNRDRLVAAKKGKYIANRQEILLRNRIKYKEKRTALTGAASDA